MKRLLFYAAIMVAVLLIPRNYADVAKLHPVQTVALYRTSSGYRIETDTNDVGNGTTVDGAFADLLATTPGVIYLDTADYFLIDYAADSAAEDMRKYLKPDVRICAIVGAGDLVKIGEFLSVQSGLRRFSGWKNGEQLAVLDCRKERIKFL